MPALSRYRLTAALALVALVTGIAVNPWNTQPASAVVESFEGAAAVKNEADEYRSVWGKSAFLPNGFLQKIATDNAVRYSTCGASCVHTDSQLTDEVPAGGSLVKMMRLSAIGSDKGEQLGEALVAKYSGYISGSANYAAAGYVEKNGRSYATLLIAHYSVAPLDRFTSTAPKLTGVPKVGSTLTAVAGTYSPAPTKIIFEWKADGQVVSSGFDTYLVGAEDLGKKITVTAAAIKAGYATSNRSVAAKSLVARGSIVKAPISATGYRNVGETLTVNTGTWSPAPSFAYRWFREDVAISGATSPSYVLQTADRGKLVNVRVVGKIPGYTTAVSMTSASKRVAARRMDASTPHIAGKLALGNTLNIAFVGWEPGATISYQWRANGVPISGATQPSLLLKSALLGKNLSVTVTGTKSGYVTTGMTSPALGPLAKYAFTSVPPPSIEGSSGDGSTLTAVPAMSTPVATSYSFQWYRNDVAIPAATTDKYVVHFATDNNTTISVRVTGHLKDYTPQPQTAWRILLVA